MPTKEEEERIREDERKKNKANDEHMALQVMMTPALAVPVLGPLAYGVGSVANWGVWLTRKLVGS